ncbi:MAG: hypothetical protein WAU86_12595 [Oricola sp.]
MTSVPFRIAAIPLAFVLAAAPAAAGDVVRGLIAGNGTVGFTGIAVMPRTERERTDNGGYPLHARSSSAFILKEPGANRKVLLEMSSRYDPPQVPVPAAPEK